MAMAEQFSRCNYETHSTHPSCCCQDAVVDRVEARITQLLGLARSSGAPTQLLKYRAGEAYEAHTDCVQGLKSNDRRWSVLLYLSQPSAGGETSFPQLGVKTSPHCGSGVLFESLGPGGMCNIRSLHESSAVQGRVPKLVLQKWFHVAPLPQVVCNGGVCQSLRYGDNMREYTGDRQPYVSCDTSRSCREYLHMPKTSRGDRSEL